jgi:hypothetical protein
MISAFGRLPTFTNFTPMPVASRHPFLLQQQQFSDGSHIPKPAASLISKRVVGHE